MNLILFFKEVKSEALKVVWSTRIDAMRMFFVVSLAVLFFSLLFVSVDSLMYRVMMFLLGA